MNFHTLSKSHFYQLHINTTTVLFEFLPITKISSFCTLLLLPIFTSLFKIFRFIPKFLNSFCRSKPVHVTDEAGSKDDLSVTEKLEGLELENCDDFAETVEETEDSVMMIGNSSKYEFLFGKDIIHYVEEPKEVEFMVQEMFVGSNDDLSVSDESEISLFEEKLELSEKKESDPPSFHFKLFDASSFRNEVAQVHNESSLTDQSIVAWNWDSLNLSTEDDKKSEETRNEVKDSFEDEKHLNSSNSEEIGSEVNDSFENESMDDQDFSYEVELISPGRYLEPDSNQDILITKKESIDHVDFVESNRKSETQVTVEEKVDDLDDEFIELGPSKVSFPGIGTESSRNFTKNEESLDANGNVLDDGLEETEEYWDTDSDSDDEDALREHESLVQQIKMELRNCGVKGLPTISEESESFKIFEDLKPLKIDHKLDYKDMMADIHKFYKIYAEKMRKLDVLNYQTLQAISFLQLKESEVFKPGKKNPGSVHFNMSKIWTYKVQKIYADPMHKSIKDMQNDLELVYVGQLCLSWEILCWLHIKGQDLIKYDSNGFHSYNRAAEEFQQFQVLLQRFMEDEPFQGQPRIQNYVRNRCMIRSLLQVPTFKDDCLKDKKELREEKDAISLASLLETIKKSILIFRDFVRSDKAASNVITKGVQGMKVVSQDTNSQLLMEEIIINLQKKERKIKENVRSQNCIVKKFQKHQEYGLDSELFSQVELRIVSRVLALSRLTTDQLLWCQNKLNNISFVKRRVHLETSFLLFPC